MVKYQEGCRVRQAFFPSVGVSNQLRCCCCDEASTWFFEVLEVARFSHTALKTHWNLE
jgi:hypothetical protein